MNLFISTSRKPSTQTRKLARWLERLLNAKTENRGKRSVEEVMQRAASAGFSRVLFIHDKNGNPAELVFRDENEGWMEPSIIVSGTVIPEKGKRKEDGKREESKRVRVPKEVEAKPLDSSGEKIAVLFGLKSGRGNGNEQGNERGNENEQGNDCEALLLIANCKEICFEVDGERVGPAIKIARLAKRAE